MAKKYKYYLAKLFGSMDPNEGYLLARGEEFESDYVKGLAIVRLADRNDNSIFNGVYSIIDIATGLKIYSAISKKRVLEIWEQRKDGDELKKRIINARKRVKYAQIVEIAKEQRKNWRKLGYPIEGECKWVKN